MNKKKVFARLKPKAASLGFNKKELWGIAEQVSDNSELDDDATDEDIDAEIDAVLPYLKVGQQQANRLVNAAKPTPTTGNEDDDDDDASVTENNKTTKGNDDEPAWFTKYRETQESRFAKLEGDKISISRKSRLEVLVKDTDKFGTRTLKNFTKMKFDNEEEFEEFLSDVEDDLEEYKQEKGDEGLDTLKNPLTGGDKTKSIKVTDADIDAVALSM